MRYLIAAILSLASFAANAGLITLYFDDRMVEIEGMTYTGAIGNHGDFTITGEEVVYKPVAPPFDEVGGPWSGTIYSPDPLVPPVTYLDCRFLRQNASDGGDILLWLDCRDAIFFNGFEPVSRMSSRSAQGS